MLYILQQIYGTSVSPTILYNALEATSKKRGTLEQDPVMEKLWRSYQKNSPYAEGLEWHSVMDSVRMLYSLGQDKK